MHLSICNETPEEIKCVFLFSPRSFDVLVHLDKIVNSPHHTGDVARMRATAAALLLPDARSRVGEQPHGQLWSVSGWWSRRAFAPVVQ